MLSISAAQQRFPQQPTAWLFTGCSLLLLLTVGVARLRTAHVTGRPAVARCNLHVNQSLQPQLRDDPLYHACHAQRMASLVAADEGQGLQLIFYGDSITERWLGTSVCAPNIRARGVPAVFAHHFARFNTSVMGVAADETAHLMWRLTHGEVPPAVAVVLIGTNDLGSAWEAADPHTAEDAVMCAVQGVKLRVQRVLELMRGLMPATHILLLGLLPRGTRPQLFGWPSVYTQPMLATNLAFREVTRPDAHLHFLDCGQRYLTPGGAAIDPRLMLDALHPSPAGYDELAQCVLPLITQLMQAADAGS